MANETPDDAMAPDIVDECEANEELLPVLKAITLGIDDEDEIISEQPPRASLMGLPVEIRLLIYQYLLNPSEIVIPRSSCSYCRCSYCGGDSSADVSECGCYNCRDDSDSKSLEQCTVIQMYPQILATCKQVFNEGVEILYADVSLCIIFEDGFVDSRLDIPETLPMASHTFIDFHDLSDHVSFWRVEQYPQQITTVKLYDYADSTTEDEIQCLFKLLQKLPNLQHIDYHIPHESTKIMHINANATMAKLQKYEARKEYVEKQVMETLKELTVVAC